MKNLFIRGSVVRYVRMPARAVDTTLLEDATRRGEWEWELQLPPSEPASLIVLSKLTDQRPRTRPSRAPEIADRRSDYGRLSIPNGRQAAMGTSLMPTREIS